MKRKILTIVSLFLTLTGLAQTGQSPNGKLTVKVNNQALEIRYQQATLQVPAIGIRTTSMGQNLRLTEMSAARRVVADYQMLAGKRLNCHNEANEYVCTYKDEKGKAMNMVLRVYNDGVAFRYELSGLHNERLEEEKTTFEIPEGTRRWIQRWTEAYEGFFPLSTTGEDKNRRWGYPALVEPSEGVFALITEANIERRQSASCLWNDKKSTSYQVRPDKNEVSLEGDWHTPWRVVMMGTLSDIVESTLVTDVSEPTRIADTSWIHPGVVSWIYWAYNRGSKDYQLVKQYIDMAVTLHLPYVLIDWEWDIMGNGGTIDDALQYAAQRGVKVLLWYNSSTAWTTNGAGGPLFKLNKPEDREKEFAMLERRGVAGVKIDFFSGDLQETMDYCIELLECAARHHLLINFHGATIPRGWQRTYPNLLSTEGVYGAEWYNNVPTFTKRAAAHNATLPFTRNVIGPMDYTPCTFSDSQHPHITSNGHELALTVLYESGLQHLADKPESYLSQPAEVQQFLKELPSVWDETRLIGGYPGEYAVIARRSGNTWYIAGINGTDSIKSISLDQKIIKGRRHITSFTDNADHPWDITAIRRLPKSVVCQPRGGFVYVIKK